jgi:hypothetical protein
MAWKVSMRFMQDANSSGPAALDRRSSIDLRRRDRGHRTVLARHRRRSIRALLCLHADAEWIRRCHWPRRVPLFVSSHSDADIDDTRRTKQTENISTDWHRPLNDTEAKSRPVPRPPSNPLAVRVRLSDNVRRSRSRSMRPTQLRCSFVVNSCAIGMRHTGSVAVNGG